MPRRCPWREGLSASGRTRDVQVAPLGLPFGPGSIAACGKMVACGPTRAGTNSARQVIFQLPSTRREGRANAAGWPATGTTTRNSPVLSDMMLTANETAGREARTYTEAEWAASEAILLV